MTAFWTLMAGITAGIVILMVGIILTRDPEQSLGDALKEGAGWGTWFMTVFGSQALVLSGL